MTNDFYWNPALFIVNDSILQRIKFLKKNREKYYRDIMELMTLMADYVFRNSKKIRAEVLKYSVETVRGWFDAADRENDKFLFRLLQQLESVLGCFSMTLSLTIYLYNINIR